ncbi:MAG: DUF1405 domain-containing protein [Haloferacaceae archaeon]
MARGLRERLESEGLTGLVSGDGLPERAPLPRWLAPLPAWLENVGLRLAPLVVVTNLLGTAFGFWYYRYQFGNEPVIAWPVVPDSPMATLFIALALWTWWRGTPNEYLNALAFFGNWKLGLWTPFVLVYFRDAFVAVNPLPLYLFLVFSHLAMVVQAFVLHRISAFPVRAVALAVAWYGFNDLVDYFVPIVGTPHHTSIPGQYVENGLLQHVPEIHTPAAAAAVVLTLTATVLALSTRIRLLESGAIEPGE